MLPIVLGVAAGVFAVLLLTGFLVDSPVLFGVLGLFMAAAAAAVVFGRRASAAAFGSVEGQPGAAAAVLTSMRGDWRVTPAVAFNRNQDLVHRVVGRPGVILVGEGSPSGTRGLMSQERRRLSRVAGDAPIYDVVVGDGEGQVALRKLQVHFTKLPRNLKPKQVNAMDARLKAIGGANIPLPKGPMPRGGRVPRGKVR